MSIGSVRLKIEKEGWQTGIRSSAWHWHGESGDPSPSIPTNIIMPTQAACSIEGKARIIYGYAYDVSFCVFECKAWVEYNFIAPIHST